MSIWIWCEDCGGRFEIKPSSFKIEDLGGGSFRLTARCTNCSEKSMARYIPASPDSPAIKPSPSEGVPPEAPPAETPPTGSPFAETMAEILREEGCMHGENEPPGPTPPRSAPVGPQPDKKY